MKRKPSELKVILEAKKICIAVMKATFNAPKQYRFSIISKIQNLSLEILEDLYISNEIFVLNASPKSLQKRIDIQRQALARLSVLSYLIKIAHQKKCITRKQAITIDDIIVKCSNLTGGWIKQEIKKILSSSVNKQI